MANRTAAALVLRDGDKPKLEQWVRSTSISAGLASRARVVLLAAEGVANQDIAAQVGMSRPTVNRRRSRYVAKGMVGLADVKRPGRPRTVDYVKIISATLKPPPKSLGVTHWSSRLQIQALDRTQKVLPMQPGHAEQRTHDYVERFSGVH